MKIEIVDTMPPPYLLPNGTIYGYYSAFLPNKTKIIPESFYIERDGHQGTQTSLTRTWVKNNQKKRTCRKVELASLEWSSAPLYCNPRFMEQGVYIDIKSAYQSIYKILGWGVDYARGLYLAPAPDPLDFPYTDLKIARSYVITGARPRGSITRVENGLLKTALKYNPLSNPSLVASVMDVLSAIARFAVYACNACYYNTDGAIMGVGEAKVFAQFLQTMGLEYSIKHRGRVYVSNVNNWEIGEKVVRYGNSGGLLRGDWISLNHLEAEKLYLQFVQAYQGRLEQ